MINIITQEKKPKIFIINCYSDNNKTYKGTYYSAPHQMTTISLAGVLHPHKTEIRTYCEFLSGTFSRFNDLVWADMIVLTGLNTAFDRMKQVAAYAKTLNPKIITVMGGSLARAIPKLSTHYFDIVATGDVEQLVDIVNQSFKGNYDSELPTPRYDLVNWMPLVGYAETSRNCNFRCEFCSMTAEDNKHFVYDQSALINQIKNIGKPEAVMLLDQNFYAGSRKQFQSRLSLLKNLYVSGKIKGWSALVTSDFYNNSENLKLAREAGCIGFFSGVESFSPTQIAAYNKRQNLILPQVEVITKSLDAGLVFHYGLMVDTNDRLISDLEAEIDYILHNSQITLPSFISLPIPLLGTPLFKRCIKNKQFLPNVKLRDMDGRSLICHPKDEINLAIELIEKLDNGYMKKSTLIKRQWQFYWLYRKKLTKWGMASALGTTKTMAFPRRSSKGREDTWFKKYPRSYLASTETLGNLYNPSIQISDQYEKHFQPLYVTNQQGELHPDLYEDFHTLFD